MATTVDQESPRSEARGGHSPRRYRVIAKNAPNDIALNRIAHAHAEAVQQATVRAASLVVKHVEEPLEVERDPANNAGKRSEGGFDGP